jgi:drug/metabolite transporter (DMT)-like permease
MTAVQLAALTTLTMFCFAGNSLLCRLALAQTPIDAATFTSVRLVAGAVTLAWLASRRPQQAAASTQGSWASAAALFAYAAAFSYAYRSLTAGTGALLLFGAVQATMVTHDMRTGGKLRVLQMLGLAVALAGLIALVLPGLASPPLDAALLMLLSGVAWGIYSLRGRGATDPVGANARNFLRAVPFAAALTHATLPWAVLDATGIVVAVASGAITSGLGYALWYRVLPQLRATSAATVQLSVPVITAAAGVLMLGESLTLRLVAASVAVLGGIALVISDRASSARASA